MALGTAGSVVAAAVVAAAVGAGTAVLLRDPAPPASSPAPADGVPALLERLDRQEKEIASLRARLDETAAALRAPRPGPGGPGPGMDGGPPPGEMGASGPRPSEESMASMSPEERAQAETVYREMREKEQEAARRARANGIEAGLRLRMDRLPATLNFTQEQKDAVLKILVARGEKIRAAFEEARAAGGPDVFRTAQEKSEGIRKEARDALALTLSPEQLKAIEDMGDRGNPGFIRRGEGQRRGQRDGTGGGNAGGGGAGGETPPR
jgi:hypothetical protein